MKHVEASAMQVATTRTGRPPSRHCATMLRRRAIQSSTVRKSDADRPRQSAVVHGVVETSRTMSPPLLQQMEAHATSSAPRRAAWVADGDLTRERTGGSRGAARAGRESPRASPRAASQDLLRGEAVDQTVAARAAQISLAAAAVRPAGRMRGVPGLRGVVVAEPLPIVMTDHR